MFSVTQAEATAIRDAFRQRGELSAVIELRRLFPGVTDNRQARKCVRMIAGWRLSEPDSATAIVATCQNQHIMNLLLVLMVLGS
jgi:hypothetical protein